MLSDLFILLIYLGVSEIIAYFLFVIANYGISSAIVQRFRLPVSELKKDEIISISFNVFECGHVNLCSNRCDFRFNGIEGNL
ncbi:hypothetical protein NGC20_13140 [Enterococcus hirae]|uniref:hypothetical protein n=1 Tax=Enterococcus hirae TaxID=1354 RepID=UPI002DB58CC8|nr:hypothetical protein [Enterococcus hirae]MEB7440930.1 hypothetical protein [Enterococcus hirae]